MVAAHTLSPLSLSLTYLLYSHLHHTHTQTKYAHIPRLRPGLRWWAPFSVKNAAATNSTKDTYLSPRALSAWLVVGQACLVRWLIVACHSERVGVL